MAEPADSMPNDMPNDMPKDMPKDEDVRAALRGVVDPEVGMNVVDLGLVYGIEIAPGRVRVAMTMTTPACPMGGMISEDAREAILDIVPEGAAVVVDLVWDPPWSPERMSEHARGRFGWS